MAPTADQKKCANARRAKKYRGARRAREGKPPVQREYVYTSRPTLGIAIDGPPVWDGDEADYAPPPGWEGEHLGGGAGEGGAV